MENNITHKKDKSISGPINIVRLEGNVFGIDKILYVFFDLHLHPEIQTRCENVFSDTIMTYLTEQFKKSGKKISCRTPCFFLA